MNKKESALSIWCDELWLYFEYILGIIMLNVLIIYWPSWDVPHRLMCLLCIMIPAHVFEEDTFPGGFFYMNNLGIGSKDPMVYPQNRLTNMWTNLGAEITFIIVLFNTAKIPAAAVTIVIFFGIAEVIGHTRGGILMYLRYKDKGKKTIYGPGSLTSYIGLLEMSVYGIYWMTKNTFNTSEVLLGILIVFGIVFIGILIPFVISFKIKSKTYAFRDNGYFSKYEN